VNAKVVSIGPREPNERMNPGETRTITTTNPINAVPRMAKIFATFNTFFIS
jgi:hypothetical protein